MAVQKAAKRGHQMAAPLAMRTAGSMAGYSAASRGRPRAVLKAVDSVNWRAAQMASHWAA